MSESLHYELKKEFQLERLILFSDAVFAIAITLLAIEIKVPEIDRHVATDHLLAENLGEMIPKFVGFFISFFIIGLYWTIHHRMFGFVVNYTRTLLFLNLLFLMAVVLMPFSTAFYSEYILRLLKVPVIIYVANITFLGIMNLVIWKYLNRPSLHLTEGISSEEKKFFTLRAVAVPVMFVFTAFIYLYVDRKLAIYIPPAIPIVIRIIKVIYKKKQKTVAVAKTEVVDDTTVDV